MIPYPHPPPPSHFTAGMDDGRTLHKKSSPKPIQDDEKAPSRPYTEYNIFFQLERERILCELEKERRENAGIGVVADDTESRDIIIAKNACDAEKRGYVSALTPSSNDDANVEESKYLTPRTSPDKVLSHDIIQSDPQDILPRPSRFMHLKLAPLWYNSTHRLAQTKLNKSRRRHRKTHGLVGFLELTKRIAKEWKQIDPETKAYCKKVADLQLTQYKEALMMTKKSQGIPVDNAGNNEVEQKAMLEVKSATYRPKVNKKVNPTTPAHVPKTPAHTSSEMSCPGDSTSLPVLHRGCGQQQKEYQQYQQHVPYPYSHLIHGNYPRQTTYHKLPPSMPPLTPTSLEFVDERNVGIYGEGEGHTALDELMYRRKQYGSQIAASQIPKRFPRTSHNVGEGRKGESNGGAPTNDHIDSTASYMSPNILEVSPNNKMSSMAITPSPSRRKEARQQNCLDCEEASTSSSLPMKKRLKLVRDESAAGIHIDPASATPGCASLTPGSTGLSFANSDISPMYLLSPSAMITPGFKFGASPMSGGLRKELKDEGMSSSPLPYIDWSPKDNSPQEAGDGDEYRMQHQQCQIPTHLIVPGQMHTDPSRYGPPPQPGNYDYPISHSCRPNDEGFNDEQMHTNWHELESHAKHRMMRERHAAMTWMYNQYGHASGESGTSARDNMTMVHSFSTPMEKELTYEAACPVDKSTNKEDIPSLESAI